MGKHNRTSNSNFNPNSHKYQQEGRRGGNSGVSRNGGTNTEALLEKLISAGNETSKLLRDMKRVLKEFELDVMTGLTVSEICTLAIGDKQLTDELRSILMGRNEDETPEDQESQKTNSADHSCTRSEKAPDTVKYALRTDFDMNAIMRAAIDATEEAPATVRTITETLVAYLKSQLKTQSSTAKRFMDELDKAVRKRTEGGSDPTDFDDAIAVLKNALPAVVAAVSDITGFDRTVVDRIAFAELLAAKRVLVSSSRVATGSEARQMMDELEKADLRGAHGKPDTNGVEVE